MTHRDFESSVLREQVEYYRRRASEYDETSLPPPGHPLKAFTDEIERALDAFQPTGDVLEIANGTGTWTRLLLAHASSVTALDAAAEMHEQSRRKLGGDARVRYIQGDVLSWRPDKSYDVVFFANWLSHVPPTIFDGFWGTVWDALKPRGRVFLVDEAENAQRYEELREHFIAGQATPVASRSLSDGTNFRVVKVFWNPRELTSRLEGLGWDIRPQYAGPFFWAEGQRVGAG